MGIGDWFRPKAGSGGGRADRTADATSDAYAQLALRLAYYPADCPPFPGPPASLTADQRIANRDAMVAAAPARLDILAAFLSGHGLSIAALRGGGGVDAARAEGAAIDRWLADWLPKRPFDPVSGDADPNPPFARFAASDRSGGDIHLSLLADLALLAGEAIRRVDPRFGWAVHGEPPFPVAAAGEPPTTLHHVVLAKAAQPGWDATILDLHEAMIQLCHTRMAPTPQVPNIAYPLWLADAAAGGFDPR